MHGYRIQGIPQAIAATARETMKSPQYGHPAHVEVARGTGPCRLCLQTFTVGGEERLRFTYKPLTAPDALPAAPGPVFIHSLGCQRYDGDVLPEALRRLPLIVEGYDAGGTLVAQQRVGSARFETVLEGVLKSGVVEYAHLRNAEAGCFIARIDRQEAVAGAEVRSGA
jgi:hypothetical protein